MFEIPGAGDITFAMLDADQNCKKSLGVIPTAGIGFFAKLFRQDT